MNVTEMHHAVELGVQQIDSHRDDDFLPEEIDYYLNKSQERFIKKRYNPFGNAYMRGFEQSQKRIEDLRKLFVKDGQLDSNFSEDTSAISGFYTDYVELPEDHFLTISQRSLVKFKTGGINWEINNGKRVPTDTNYGEKVSKNRVAQSDQIYSLLNDPFNTTKYDDPIADFNENQINIYTDNTFIVDKLFLNYIRHPKKVNYNKSINCELPQHTHEEIVDGAVRLILGTIDSMGPEYKAQQLERNE